MRIPALSALFAVLFILPAFADTLASGEFERRSKRLQGTFEITQVDGVTTITFSDNFRAARGPDVKVFLSPTAYGDVTGKTATQDAYFVGELKEFRGGQSYTLPADVDLSAYRSLLIHCEEYSVLWGGSDFVIQGA